MRVDSSLDAPLNITSTGKRAALDELYNAVKEELELRTKQFALEIIRLVGDLPKSRVADVLGLQLLRSGTSVGANHREADRASSHDDFIHKLSICEKEAAETEYWLELLLGAGIGSLAASEKLRAEANELLRIFVASGRTAKSRR